MLEGYVYYVAQNKIVDESDDPKYYAYTIVINRNNNLVKEFARGILKGAERVFACKNKREAEEIRNRWNENYKKNGTYAW